MTSCPAGQRWSSLLEMCVAEDSDGGVVSTPAGNVMVNENTNGQQQGKFWEQAPEYIDSLANLWNAIKGRPVQQQEPGAYAGYYQQKPDQTGTWVMIGVVVLFLFLLMVLLFIRRKK